MQHRHTTQNNWDTPFDFTSENYEHVSPAPDQHRLFAGQCCRTEALHATQSSRPCISVGLLVLEIINCRYHQMCCCHHIGPKCDDIQRSSLPAKE